MKRRILSSILILVIITFTSVAQTQQGLVKIKGRYSPSGQVIPGPPLAGVSVKVKGRNAVLSNKNGTFQFPVPSAKFYVERVALAGYQLTDPDLLSRQFSYSKDNTLAVVMERHEDYARDVEDAKNSIRKQMRKEIRKREDEIDRLREENKISEQKYRDLMQKCREDEEKSENLVQAMAERFASIDFDQIDEENKQLNILILNGELVKADSLLRSKGNFEERVANLDRVKKANTEIRKGLEASENYAAYYTENLAQEALNRHQIHALRFQNDSAAYYLERRAALDTLNAEWQLDAGIFMLHLAIFDKAMNFFQTALAAINSNSDVNQGKLASCYRQFGILYRFQHDYSKALHYHAMALDINTQLFGKNSLEVAQNYNDLGLIHLEQKNLANATDCFNNCLDIWVNLDVDNLQECAIVLNNLGGLSYEKGAYHESLIYYLMSIEIEQKISGENTVNAAACYNNIANVLLETNEFEGALEYHFKALNIKKNIYGENHPNVALSYNNIGSCYEKQNKYDDALIYFKKSLDIAIKFNGEFSADVARAYNNIGSLYHTLGNLNEALNLYQKSLDIWKSIYGESHPNVATGINNIASLYSSLGDDITALKYYHQSLALKEKNYERDHYEIAQSHHNIGCIYYNNEDFDKALEHFLISLKIYSKVFGEDNKTTDKACEYVYRSYIKLIQRNKVKYKKRFISFLKNVAFTMTTLDKDSPAVKNGLNGTYYLLQYNDWTQDSLTSSIYDAINSFRGKNKTIVIMNDNSLSQYRFEDMIGAEFKVKYINPSKKNTISKQYENWKSKQQ